MSNRINELRVTNTSGVPGLRLNRRRGALVIDVTWYAEGRRCSTSFPADWAPVAAVRRAMQHRTACTGAIYAFGSRAAWQRISQGARL